MVMYLNGSNMNLSSIGVEKFKLHIVYVWPIYKNQWGVSFGKIKSVLGVRKSVVNDQIR